jgi:hypothetical protein
VHAGNFCIDVNEREGRATAAAAFVVLVDFGFARRMPANLVLHAGFGGTPDFASTRCLAASGPDDLSGLPTQAHTSDVPVRELQRQ